MWRSVGCFYPTPQTVICTCAEFNELPSNISTMFHSVYLLPAVSFLHPVLGVKDWCRIAKQYGLWTFFSWLQGVSDLVASGVKVSHGVPALELSTGPIEILEGTGDPLDCHRGYRRDTYIHSWLSIFFILFSFLYQFFLIAYMIQLIKFFSYPFLFFCKIIILSDYFY